jgi:UDP-2,3-diacylglucosamine hydrolase
VAHYFASDVHLRFDQPDRDRRFHAWLSRLTPGDSLVIVGDLCDFWMAARRREIKLFHSESLRALADFRRQGGSLAIMPGNHDVWLCPFYETELGAAVVSEPYDLKIHGQRLRLVHGHLLGARKRWKSMLETHAFFEAFGHTPRPLAMMLDSLLTRRNERTLADDEARHMRIYRSYADDCRAVADLVVIGHVHTPADLAESRPRLIVLGGWQAHSNYLKIDESGAITHVRNSPADNPSLAALGHLPSSTHEVNVHEV